MKYTFLVPAYKGRYLNEMLLSIQRQTYTKFKVIISDDFSPEDLHSICAAYLTDSRFSYRCNKENMGSKSLVSHWNLLVNMCDTEFLILACDDDLYEPQFLEEIDKLTQKYHDVELFRGRVKNIDEYGEVYAVEEPSDEYDFQLKAMYSHFLPTKIHCIGNFVFKTAALQQFGGFVDFPMAWYSDDATTLACMEKGICNTNNVCFSFRNSPLSISFNPNVTHEVARAKIEATKSFYNWSLLMSKDILKPNSKYTHVLYKKMTDGIYARASWMLHYYYKFLKRKEKLKLLSWMRNNHFEDRGTIHIVKTYIKAIIN